MHVWKLPKMMCHSKGGKMNRCEFYPTDEELNRDGPFCHCSSDITGVPPCTYEYGQKCQWAKEERNRKGKKKEVN